MLMPPKPFPPAMAIARLSAWAYTVSFWVSPEIDAEPPTIALVTVEAVMWASASPPVTAPRPVASTLSVDLAVLVASASIVRLRPAVTVPFHAAAVGAEISAAGRLTATPSRIPPVMTFDLAAALLVLFATNDRSAPDAAIEPEPFATTPPSILASLEPIASDARATEPVWMSALAVFVASARTTRAPAAVTTPSRVARVSLRT